MALKPNLFVARMTMGVRGTSVQGALCTVLGVEPRALEQCDVAVMTGKVKGQATDLASACGLRLYTAEVKKFRQGATGNDIEALYESPLTTEGMVLVWTGPTDYRRVAQVHPDGTVTLLGYLHRLPKHRGDEFLPPDYADGPLGLPGGNPCVESGPLAGYNALDSTRPEAIRLANEQRGL